jgi:hypothetical protein
MLRFQGKAARGIGVKASADFRFYEFRQLQKAMIG